MSNVDLSAAAQPSGSDLPAAAGSEPTAAEIVRRAESFIPELRAGQAETENRTFYSPSLHTAFSQAGFYRILVPRRFGGYELGVEAFMRVAVALASGCPSSAWMYVFGAAHALPAATLFDEATQRSLFSGGEFICPATVAPAGTAVRVDGGWMISGTWTYCSGAPYATHFMAHTMVSSEPGQPPAPLLFIAHRAQWRRLEDWGDQLGLRGSGSHSLLLEDAFVPDDFTRHGHLSQVDPRSGLPGARVHANPEYRGGQISFMLLELAALAVGMARGGLEAYEELLRTRTTSYFPIRPRTEDPDYQFTYGEAAGLIAAAESALFGAVREWSQICARGSAGFSREVEMRLVLIGREAVRLCWRAVEGQIFPSAGSSSVRAGERIERVWRDLSMLHSHAGVATFMAKLANRELAKARFGISD